MLNSLQYLQMYKTYLKEKFNLFKNTMLYKVIETVIIKMFVVAMLFVNNPTINTCRM
jgi:hypothetical protein